MTKHFQFFILTVSIFFASYSQAKTVQELCSFISSYSTASGLECVKTIATAPNFDENAVNFCYTISQYSIANGVQCVKSIAGNSYQTEAMAVCSFISTYSTAEGTRCVTGIANKIFLNGTPALCQNIAKNSISSGVQCLIDAAQIAPSKSCPTLKDVNTSITSALDAIYGGTPREAVRLLNEMQDKITICLQ